MKEKYKSATDLRIFNEFRVRLQRICRHRPAKWQMFHFLACPLRKLQTERLSIQALHIAYYIDR